MPKTEPISIANETHGLAGNLVLPEGDAAGGKLPGAVILGGPGPVPLQRYSAEGAKQWPVLWSESLGAAGVGTLCYDQRGSGLSTGVYHEADWDGLYDDAVAAAEMLAIQPEIGKVAAIAWDEGCGFALKLAAEGAVHALVLMAPACHNAEERYEADIRSLAARRGLSDRVVQIRVNQWRGDVQATMQRVQQGETIASTDVGGQVVQTNLVRFLQNIAFNPAAVAPAVKVPVLILHGADDTAIPPSESEALAAALTGPVERIVYPGVAHFLYRHPRALADAAAWLNRTLA